MMFLNNVVYDLLLNHILVDLLKPVVHYHKMP